ncbi:hypothetical protein CBR_g60308 [Chara braunii]|uniref:Uncharacterized protein n=1 Tax=Chara braunii TaxID=69332 RepID=A0A388MFE7_CHABU|nr:hypothetical protein CBR_g60308 [Chara braunii]|eukprot:GBG93202.1 hypothetical protein CBR_g60308 [Chara braunii]
MAPRYQCGARLWRPGPQRGARLWRPGTSVEHGYGAQVHSVENGYGAQVLEWSTTMAPRSQSRARLYRPVKLPVWSTAMAPSYVPQTQFASVEHGYGAQLSTADAGRQRGARLWRPGTSVENDYGAQVVVVVLAAVVVVVVVQVDSVEHGNGAHQSGARLCA